MSPFVIPAGTLIGYPKKTVLQVPYSVTLPEKGLLLLVGQNGTGKTTLLKFIAGCLPESRVPLARTVYLPEKLEFPSFLNSRSLSKSCLGTAAGEIFRQDAQTLGLSLSTEFGKLSKGNQQKVILALAVAQANNNSAAVLLLDEPLSGLDFAVQKSAWHLIQREREQRLVIASMHPDHIEAPPDALLTVIGGELRLVSGTFHTWADIEPVLTVKSNLVAA